MISTTTEARRSFRVSCYALVTVRCGRDVMRRLNGLAANVSLDGASVVLPEPIPAGTRVTVTFLAAERPGAPETIRIEKDAEVVWVRETAETSDGVRHGLRFNEPDVDLLLRAWPGQRLPG